MEECERPLLPPFFFSFFLFFFFFPLFALLSVLTKGHRYLRELEDRRRWGWGGGRGKGGAGCVDMRIGRIDEEEVIQSYKESIPSPTVGQGDFSRRLTGH